MGKGENVDGFVVPRDIIIDILKQLPGKALLRFRCVSKPWCSIIDDPLFIRLHNKHSYTRPGGVSILLRHKDYVPDSQEFYSQFYSVDPEGGPHMVDLLRVQQLPTQQNCFEVNDTLQSVNGLICIYNRIWNPTTRELIAIPPRKMSVTSFLDVDLELPLSNFKFYSSFFLGFDPSSDEYKIVNKCVFISCRGITVERCTQYKILTLGTDSWRDIDSVPDELDPFTRNKRCCCIAGVIYSFGSTSDGDVIMAFELRHEKFRIIPFPVDDDDDRYYVDSEVCNLIQVRDCLAVIYHNVTDVTTIWILEDYENMIWNRQSFIFPDHYEGKPLVFPDHYNRRPIYDQVGDKIYFEPIGDIYTGEILLKSGSRNLHDLHWVYDPESLAPKLFYYDLETKRLRMLDDLSNLAGNVLRDASYTKHVETLFRLKR